MWHRRIQRQRKRARQRPLSARAAHSETRLLERAAACTPPGRCCFAGALGSFVAPSLTRIPSRDVPTTRRQQAAFGCREDRSTGFTLVEVLIVVAILGILVAIALPSYHDQVRKSARAEAQSFLTDAASRQQQYLVDKRRYATSAELGVPLPKSLQPKFSPVVVNVPDVTPPTFELRLVATGDQAKDKCPTLTIDNRGNRGPDGCPW
jgi:type IV pilus assembly protein PilE